MATPTSPKASDHVHDGVQGQSQSFSFSKVRRNPDDKVIAGVCGGLGEALAVDPLWFRLAFAVLALGNGAGVGLYILAWILIPEAAADDEKAGAAQIDSSRGRMIAGFALVAVGVVLLVDLLVPWFDRVMWPIAVLVLGGGLVYAGSRR